MIWSYSPRNHLKPVILNCMSRKWGSKTCTLLSEAVTIRMFLLVQHFYSYCNRTTLHIGIEKKSGDSRPYLRRPEVFILERDKRKPETALRLPQFGSEC